MRPSNRTRILDAAVRVIQEDGVTAVTQDAVAVAVGMTRSGVLYHFPSREDLLQGIRDHLADQFEASLVAANGGRTAEESTPTERLIAYVRTCAQSATRAELQFALEYAGQPEFDGRMQEVLSVWAPPADAAMDDDIALDQLIARLAGDGLWLYESMHATALDDEIRQAVVARLAATLAEGT